MESGKNCQQPPPKPRKLLLQLKIWNSSKTINKNKIPTADFNHLRKLHSFQDSQRCFALHLHLSLFLRSSCFPVAIPPVKILLETLVEYRVLVKKLSWPKSKYIAIVHRVCFNMLIEIQLVHNALLLLWFLNKIKHKLSNSLLVPSPWWFAELKIWRKKTLHLELLLFISTKVSCKTFIILYSSGLSALTAIRARAGLARGDGRAPSDPSAAAACAPVVLFLL